MEAMSKQNTFLPPELLILILRQLPQANLLHAQRVCRTWRDFIQSSVELQRKLFFLPTYLSSKEEYKTVPILPNPLLLDHFPGFFDHAKQGNEAILSSSKWAIDSGIQPKSAQSSSTQPDDSPSNQDASNQDGEINQIVVDAYARPEASWRRMIPCSPSPLRLQVFLDKSGGHFYAKSDFRELSFEKESRNSGTDSKEAFPTFGMIYDSVCQHACDWKGYLDRWAWSDIPGSLTSAFAPFEELPAEAEVSLSDVERISESNAMMLERQWQEQIVLTPQSVSCLEYYKSLARRVTSFNSEWPWRRPHFRGSAYWQDWRYARWEWMYKIEGLQRLGIDITDRGSMVLILTCPSNPSDWYFRSDQFDISPLKSDAATENTTRWWDKAQLSLEFKRNTWKKGAGFSIWYNDYEEYFHIFYRDIFRWGSRFH